MGSDWLVQGIAEERDEADVADLALSPCAPGAKSHVVRIVPTQVTGGRLELTERLVAGDR